MPQLDFVTYFPQSLWFNILFWVGFFYFLYTIYPLLSSLIKWRRFYQIVLIKKCLKFLKLFRTCMAQISSIFFTFSVKTINRVSCIEKEQRYLILKKNKGIYLIFYKYLVSQNVF